MKNWPYTDLDRRMAAELQPPLPTAIFDSHAHIYRKDSFKPAYSEAMGDGQREATALYWQSQMQQLMGPKKLAGLFCIMPFTSVEGAVAENAWLFDQVKTVPGSKGLAVVAPETTWEQIAPFLSEPDFAGFKVYHTYSSEANSYESALSSYLPEWVWKIADERGLSILLHMVRSGALADPGNQREINEKCRKYPRARLILAHAARGFHAPNTLKGLASLRGLQNVWFEIQGPQK